MTGKISWQTLVGNLLRRSIVFFALIVIGYYFSHQTDGFFERDNLINIAEQNVDVIIITVGMTLTMLVGGIDLSVGSVAALGGAVSAGLIVREKLPLEASVAITLAMGFGVGLVNGSLIVFGRLPPFVATLATMGVARGLTLLYTKEKPISGLGDSYTVWGRGDFDLPVLGLIPRSVVVAALVMIIMIILMTRTRWGLYVYAIGGNEETARLTGVPVAQVKLITYGISSMLASISGMLLTARLFSAQPRMGVGLELDGIAASVLGGVSLFGGVGNIPGSVIGALFVGTFKNGMNLMRVEATRQQMITGAIFVAAVTLDTVIKRLQRRG